MSSFALNTQQTSHTLHGTISEDFWNWLRDNVWVLEPSEPQHIAAPVPSRARASYADILDNEWELWRGGVRLSSTKQQTVQRECPVSSGPMDCLLFCAHLGVARLGSGRGQSVRDLAAAELSPPGSGCLSCRRWDVGSRVRHWIGLDRGRSIAVVGHRA